MNIPLDVEVHCADGLCGRSIITMTNPITKETSHLVVAESKAPHIKRLVPIKLVKETTPQLIRLSCSREELSEIEQLEKFVVNPKDNLITRLVLRTGQV